MKTALRSFLLIISSCLVASSAIAQQEMFNINPQSSDVAITLGDVLHVVHGNFHVQSGSVHFDRNAPAMSGLIVVAANSGRTGNDSRDHRMLKNVLDAPRFPDISFVPASYEGKIAPAGDSMIQVSGTFTLQGTPHQLTVPIHLRIDGPNCTARSEFSVPYVKWGLKDPSTFILRVGKEVTVDVTLIGTLSPVS